MMPGETVVSKEEAEIAEYDRVKNLALSIVRAGGPLSYVPFDRVAEILKLDVNEFNGLQEKTEVIAAMMHRAFGTGLDSVRGIGTNNEYLGYHDEYKKNEGTKVDTWDFMPLYNHPYIRMTVVRNLDDAGIRISEIDKEADKLQLRLTYREARNLTKWESSSRESIGVFVDDNGGKFPGIDRKTRFPKFDNKAKGAGSAPRRRQPGFVQGALDMNNADNDHAEELHEDYAEVHRTIKAILESVGRQGGTVDTSRLLKIVSPLYEEQFEPEDMIDLLKLTLGMDDKKAVNGRVAPYLLVNKDWNYTKRTGMVVDYQKWTFIPISGSFMVEFTPYYSDYNGDSQKINQVQIEIIPVKNYGKLIEKILAERGKPDPRKMDKKMRKQEQRRQMESIIERDEERRLARATQDDFFGSADGSFLGHESRYVDPEPLQPESLPTLLSDPVPLSDYEQLGMSSLGSIPVVEKVKSIRNKAGRISREEAYSRQPALFAEP